MNGKHLAIVLTVLLLSVTATAAMLIPVPEKAKENMQAENAPVIEEAQGHLVLDTPGLEKKVLIHYAKPPCNNDGVCDPDEKKNCGDCRGNGEEPDTSCYGFLGKGVKWKDLPQEYVIDPDNSQGIDENFVVEAVYLAAEEWDSHTGTELLSTYTIVHDASWDGDPGDRPDGSNELLFGDYPEQGVIAITVTWGYFTGKPSNREIVEFDVLFDTDYAWGDAVLDSNMMDLQGLATHEIGHGLGLDDLYQDACNAETMYGYGETGDADARTLEAGDIAGLQSLYGS